MAESIRTGEGMIEIDMAEFHEWLRTRLPKNETHHFAPPSVNFGNSTLEISYSFTTSDECPPEEWASAPKSVVLEREAKAAQKVK